jgi:hypothetical protein
MLVFPATHPRQDAMRLEVADRDIAPGFAVQEPRPIVLPLSKTPLVAGAIVMALMLVGAITLLPHSPKIIFGMVGTGIAAAACAISLAPPSIRIELSSESLAVWFFWKKVEFVGWAEVENIRIGWYGYEAIEMRWNRWLFLDYSRGGRANKISICPYNFGFNAEEMMAFLSSYWKRARSVRADSGREAVI